MRNDNGPGFGIGLLCGAVVGAALGVLFAPKSGAATRRDLARSADGLRLQGMDLYDDVAETAATLSDAVSDVADRATEFVTGAANEMTNEMKTPARRPKAAGA